MAGHASGADRHETMESVDGDAENGNKLAEVLAGGTEDVGEARSKHGPNRTKAWMDHGERQRRDSSRRKRWQLPQP